MYIQAPWFVWSNDRKKTLKIQTAKKNHKAHKGLY